MDGMNGMNGMNGMDIRSDSLSVGRTQVCKTMAGPNLERTSIPGTCNFRTWGPQIQSFTGGVE